MSDNHSTRREILAMATPRIAPLWLIGLSMSPFGFYGGILFYAIPQLLAARHVPEEHIAGLTGLLILPGVLCFLIAPILDVRFSRRWYATVCGALATGGLVSVPFCREGQTHQVANDCFVIDNKNGRHSFILNFESRRVVR